MDVQFDPRKPVRLTREQQTERSRPDTWKCGRDTRRVKPTDSECTILNMIWEHGTCWVRTVFEELKAARKSTPEEPKEIRILLNELS